MEKSAWQIIEEKIPDIKIYLVLIAIAFIAYVNILPNGFLWDDELQIVNNRLIQTPGHLKEILLSDTGNYSVSGSNVGCYRPLMNFSYWLNYQIFGLNAWGFHLFQILLHILNVLLVFWLIKEILKRAGVTYAGNVSFLTSAVFAVHPGISEAVQYLAAVGDPLFVLFSLLSLRKLLTGINYTTKEIGTKNIICSAVYGFLAYASKESAAAIFAIGFLYLYLFLKPSRRVYLKYLAGGLIATAAYAILRFAIAAVKYYVADSAALIARTDLVTRLFTIPKELITYLEIIFWPAHLQIFQNFIVHSPGEVNFWLPLLILAVILASIFWFVRKQTSNFKKLCLFFATFYVLFLLPILNIIPLSMTVAERWQYFPSIGILTLIFLIIFQAFEKKHQKINLITLILFLITIPTFALLTIIRDGNWRNGLTLYGHDIKYTRGDNAALENSYGVELYRIGKTDEAKMHIERSASLMDSWFTPLSNLGALYQNEGDLQKAKSYYQQSIGLADDYLAYQNLATIYLKIGAYNEAQDFSEKALRKFPWNSQIYFVLATAKYLNGDATSAEQMLLEYLNHDPQNATAQQLYNLIKNRQEINFDQ